MDSAVVDEILNKVRELKTREPAEFSADAWKISVTPDESDDQKWDMLAVTDRDGRHIERRGKVNLRFNEVDTSRHRPLDLHS